jgi:twinkle protein
MTTASPSPFRTAQPSGYATTAISGAGVVHLRPLTPAHMAALEARSIDAETAVRHGVEASEVLGGDAVAIPYLDNGKIVGRKHRTLSGEKRFVQDKGSLQILWNIDCLRDETLRAEPLIICEGELDAIAALQSGYRRVVSVPGGAPSSRIEDTSSSKYGFLEHAAALLTPDNVPAIILAVDTDANGANLREDLAIRLGAARCKFVTYPKPPDQPPCKDLNDALMVYGEKGVVASISNARPCRIHGYYELSELPELGPNPSYRAGIIQLDELYRLRRGDMTVITGIPGHGKSSFINEITCRMAQVHGWKTVFASFEQQPQSDHRRALRSFYLEKLETAMSPEERARADAWIGKHFGFIVPSDDDEVTLSWLLSTTAQAVLRKEASILVIDPWNELDHSRDPEMTQTEYVGFAIKTLKRFAKKYRIHLIVAAHPAKMHRGKDGKYPIPSLYDISDSSHWNNKPDVGIVVHREDVTNNETLIRVLKVRYNATGKPGDVTGLFNIERSRYTIAEREGL